MGSETYHEPYDVLSPITRDLHRALVSLKEEIEAIDWYQQRAEACVDTDLRDILLHNRNEEIEHAMMTLEWLRRTNSEFDQRMRRYLFTTGSLTEIEDSEEKGGDDKGFATVPSGARPTSEAALGKALGIGSLRGENP